MTGVEALVRMLPTLAVIVGALLLLRHWAQKGRGGSSTPLRVVSRAGVAKGSVVAVVEVGGRRLLVGAADQGISLLTELDPDAIPVPEAAASQLPAASQVPTPASQLPTPAPVSLHTTTDSSPAAPATDRQRLLDQLRQGAVGMNATSSTSPSTPGRPRMAPLDRLRHLTVRTPVANRPSRPNRVHPRP